MNLKKNYDGALVVKTYGITIVIFNTIIMPQAFII